MIKYIYFLLIIFFIGCTKDAVNAENLNSDKLNNNSLVQKEKSDADSFKDEFRLMSKAEKEACLKTEKTDRRYIINDNDKYGFIDGCGNVIIKPQYEAAFEFSEGFAAVRYKGLYGYIDKAGNVVIKFKFNKAWFFQEGVARVKTSTEKGLLWGYIDKKGEWVIKPQFNNAYSFLHGMAITSDDKKTNIINTKGNVLKSFDKSYVVGFSECSRYFTIERPLPCFQKKPYKLIDNSYDYSGQKFEYMKFDRYFMCNGTGFAGNKKESLFFNEKLKVRSRKKIDMTRSRRLCDEGVIINYEMVLSKKLYNPDGTAANKFERERKLYNLNGNLTNADTIDKKIFVNNGNEKAEKKLCNNISKHNYNSVLLH